MFKKTISLLLIICMLTVGLCSCGDVDTKPESSEPAGTVLDETDDSITVVDQAGRIVTVPKDYDSIALCYRVVIRFLLSLDQGDKIKGIGKSEEFLEVLEPGLKDCVDVGKGVADIEALAELNPDIFFHKSHDVETLEAVEELGIPSVGIDVETPEEMIVALDLLGKVCGQQEKAQQLIDYYDKKLADAEEKTASLKEKKTAVIMGSSIGKVADASMLQGEMIERAGGINAAAEINASELWPTAGTEQIFAWNPDYIFITGSEGAVYTAEDIMNDPAWSEMEAVKNKHIYVMPAVVDSWEFPGVVSTLGIDYMMHIMYPELMSDEELVQNVDDFYQLSYGRTFDRNYLGY